MASPRVINLGQSPGRGFGGPRFRSPLDSIMATQPQGQNDDLIALLLSVVMQEQARGERQQESAADRELRQAMFEEQTRATGVAEGLRRDEFGELRASNELQRGLLKEAAAKQGVESLLSEQGRISARGQELDLGVLGGRQELAQLLDAEDFARGQRTMTPALRRVGRAIDRMESFEDASPKQARELLSAVESLLKGTKAAVGPDSRLAKDGFSQGELLGVLGGPVELLDSIDELLASADDATRRRFGSLGKLVDTKRDELFEILDRLPPSTATQFAKESLQRRIGFQEAEPELQSLFGGARLQSAEGASAAAIRRDLTSGIAGLQSGRGPFEVEGVGGDVLPDLRSILDAPAPERRPSFEGAEGLSPAVRDIFAGEFERREQRTEDVETRAERERELEETFRAQTKLGLRGVGPGFLTDLQLAGSKIAGGAGGLLNAIGGIGADLPGPAVAAPEQGPDIEEFLREIERNLGDRAFEEALRKLGQQRQDPFPFLGG